MSRQSVIDNAVAHDSAAVLAQYGIPQIPEIKTIVDLAVPVLIYEIWISADKHPVNGTVDAKERHNIAFVDFVSIALSCFRRCDFHVIHPFYGAFSGGGVECDLSRLSVNRKVCAFFQVFPFSVFHQLTYLQLICIQIVSRHLIDFILCGTEETFLEFLPNQVDGFQCGTAAGRLSGNDDGGNVGFFFQRHHLPFFLRLLTLRRRLTFLFELTITNGFFPVENK